MVTVGAVVSVGDPTTIGPAPRSRRCRRVPRLGLKRVRSVGSALVCPARAEWRLRVGTYDGAINFERDRGDADCVRGGGGDSDVARHLLARGRRRDADGGGVVSLPIARAARVTVG